uniref:Interstitial collagenase n=1 Tax=Aquarana catesbeiana TaxID=8400 RepID=MMP1_AQUCT|nr:RecName: Full=Interstitial collagenase; AltName: Full=Matrix metalloproteinase-1; Short=MMP-1; AltName: Full=TC1; Flags: Precursor [Aquarana catesbeiana]AAB32661.1 collagenase [Aquarana catesbeiana]
MLSGLWSSILALLGVFLQSVGEFRAETQEQDVEIVQKYLKNYYNSDKRNSGLVVEILKQFFGLKVTGKPDAETLVMKQSTCGVPDVGEYVLTPGNPRWENTHLTYRIENYTPDLVSPLTFTKVSEGQADIMISFVRGDHRDKYPFDGPGGNLAHASQPGPGIGGDAHFDEYERWTKNFQDYNLYRVAAHELGHSLGLSHSTDIGALMYPTYLRGDVQLSQDDIDGPSGNPVQPRGPQTPQVCDSKLTFDAITTVRGELMFFKMRTNRFYPEVELGLQAAYEMADRDEVRFFKGNKYWAVSGQDVLYGYPKDIHSSFGFPTGVAHECWSYDEYKQSMDTGYADEFPGDAVFQKFFHGTRQYQFDLKTKRILTLQKANSWFNCRKN